MKNLCRILLTIIAFQTLVSAIYAEDADAQGIRARVIKALPTVESVAALIDGDITLLEVSGQPGFFIRPKNAEASSPLLWVWYSPTIRGQPRPAHAWMFRQFLDNGIAIAGIDVGESMGNPTGRKTYREFHKHLVENHGFAKKAVLMPQSRGGLMLYNWAAENPKHVAAVAGIYTVCDLSSWPGLAKASAAYGTTEQEFGKNLHHHNPLERLAPLAKQKIPILHIHGDRDRPVPIERNAAELVRRYRELGGEAELIVVPGKGHEEAKEIFQRQQLVDFVMQHAHRPDPQD